MQYLRSTLFCATFVAVHLLIHISLPRKLNESSVAQDALRDAYNSGHQIASHTWSHKNLVEIVDDEETFNQEIVLLEQVVQDLIGVK